ncbi:Non-specific serine/threonine protein kinase [Bertholletia excelsa]
MMTTFVLLLLILIPVASPLSFNFTGFRSDDRNITYERACAENNAIQLTKNVKHSIARATYAKPLHLYDKSTRRLTDFNTHFSFVIDSNKSTNYGDGIVFFLAPVNSRIPPGVSEGGRFGLTTEAETNNSTDYPFVAVEFDIYKNPYDPKPDHVGIDLNSVLSVTNITWWSSIPDGRENQARISYDSVSKNLSVVFTGFFNNKTVLQNLSYVVDLREYLPSLVTFGFAAATGDSTAAQTVLSWSFNSTLPDEIVTSSANHSSNKSDTGLAIGLSVGGVVASGLVLILFVMWKKRKNSWENEDNEEIEWMRKNWRGVLGRRSFCTRSWLKQQTNLQPKRSLEREEWEQCVVHRDIKSCNVMLDSNFNAKLGDFGLARLIDHEKTSQTTNVAGTMGYMAPEYCITGKASKESDMFSFGVVALEIACGRKPINHNLAENSRVMVEWVWELCRKGKLLDAADPKLSGEFIQEEMERLMIVGLWCAHPNSKLRPSIGQVIQIINFEASLPVLSLEMPEAN